MQSATFTAEEDPTGKLAEQYAKPFLGYGEKWSEGTLAYVAKFNTTAGSTTTSSPGSPPTFTSCSVCTSNGGAR